MTCSTSQITYSDICRQLKNNKFLIQTDESVIHIHSGDETKYQDLVLAGPNFEIFTKMINSCTNFNAFWYNEIENRFYSNSIMFDAESPEFDWHVYIQKMFSLENQVYFSDAIREKTGHNMFKCNEFKLFLRIKKELNLLFVPEISRLTMNKLFCRSISKDFEKWILEIQKTYSIYSELILDL